MDLRAVGKYVGSYGREGGTAWGRGTQFQQQEAMDFEWGGMGFQEWHGEGIQVPALGEGGAAILPMQGTSQLSLAELLPLPCTLSSLAHALKAAAAAVKDCFGVPSMS